MLLSLYPLTPVIVLSHSWFSGVQYSCELKQYLTLNKRLKKKLLSTTQKTSCCLPCWINDQERLEKLNHMTKWCKCIKKSSRYEKFSIHTNTKKGVFSNCSTLESIFKMFCFGWSLYVYLCNVVWTEGLTLSIKLHSQIYPAYCGQGLGPDSLFVLSSTCVEWSLKVGALK